MSIFKGRFAPNCGGSHNIIYAIFSSRHGSLFFTFQTPFTRIFFLFPFVLVYYLQKIVREYHEPIGCLRCGKRGWKSGGGCWWEGSTPLLLLLHRHHHLLAKVFVVVNKIWQPSLSVDDVTGLTYGVGEWTRATTEDTNFANVAMLLLYKLKE